MGLFEQSKTEASETDKIMNRLSREQVIKSSDNPTETEQLLQSLDLEGFQYYMEMIEGQKQRIKKTQKKLMIFNMIVASLFTMMCLCDVFKVFASHQNIFAAFISLGPLYLTCIVLLIALCKIRSSIKAISIAQLHEKMMFIHFFNIITYSALATASNITGHLRSKFDANGSHEE